MYSEHKCVIEKKIKDKSFRRVNCFLKLRDNKTILCGCDKVFCFYNMEREKYITTMQESTRVLLLIDKETFLSCYGNKILVWKY